MAARIERDSLGDVHVPADALYGAQPQRATQNFQISGLKPRQAFIWSMATIKRAAAEVNRDLGLLDSDRADAIIQAAQEVSDGKWNDHVNMAQSANDTIPTAVRLGCLWRLDELLDTLKNLVEALNVKAAEFDDI